MNNQYQATDESLLRGQETKKKSSIGLNLFSSSSKAGKTSADYDYSMLSTSEYVNMDLDAPKTQPQTQEKLQPNPNTSSLTANNLNSKPNLENIKPPQNTSFMPFQTQYPYQMQTFPSQEQNYFTNSQMMQSQQSNQIFTKTIASCLKCGTVMQIPADAEKYSCPTCKQINTRGIQQQTYVQPPKPQYRKVICGVCKITLQYLPVSEYFRCVCGNVNYLPLKQGTQQTTAPYNSNYPTNLTTSTQFSSNIQAYGYNNPKDGQKPQEALSKQTIQTFENKQQQQAFSESLL